jgi:hypothetical protein
LTLVGAKRVSEPSVVLASKRGVGFSVMNAVEFNDVSRILSVSFLLFAFADERQRGAPASGAAIEPALGTDANFDPMNNEMITERGNHE